MEDSVLFNSPLLLLCFLLAIFFCVLELVKPSSGYILPIISAAIFTGSFIYLLIAGGTLQEALIISLVFFFLNVTVFYRKGGKDDDV